MKNKYFSKYLALHDFPFRFFFFNKNLKLIILKDYKEQHKNKKKKPRIDVKLALHSKHMTE